jgi:hypothetical protein
MHQNVFKYFTTKLIYFFNLKWYVLFVPKQTYMIFTFLYVSF